MSLIQKNKNHMTLGENIYIYIYIYIKGRKTLNNTITACITQLSLYST